MRIKGSCLLFATLLVAVSLAPVDAIDDALSYKSLVLGSLASGQVASGRVSSSSCHNYYMNVSDIGYSLVVDLNTSSSALFLLVKASPILRHSLEDEHNYANYYQFKKQGGHNGVVVTSDHLSPGRWYIGVCNYIQEVPAFVDKKRAGKGGGATGRIGTEYAEYSFIPTLEPSKVDNKNGDCGPECQGAETEARLALERTAPELVAARSTGSYDGFEVEPVAPSDQRHQQQPMHPSAEEVPVCDTPPQPLAPAVAPAPTQGECGGPVPVEQKQQQQQQHQQQAGWVPGDAATAPSSIGMVHAAWALWLAGVAGGLYLRYGAAKGGAFAPPKPAPQQAEPPVGGADEPSRKPEEAAAKALQIEKQLEEARRALEKLERQLQEERKASESSKADDAAAELAVESATKDLSMRLVQERERTGELMSEAGRWRQAAEDAQMNLSRLQREKAAAEREKAAAVRAAEVLEQEVDATRRQFQELKWHEEGVASSKFAPSPIVGAPSPVVSVGMTSPIGPEKYMARQGMVVGSGSPGRGRMSELLMPGAASPVGSADEVFSSSFSSPAPVAFASPPAPLESFASTPATPSPYHQAPSSRHFGDGEARPPPHPFRRGQTHPLKESVMNSSAFAAFMGVDAGHSDLIGELEPPTTASADAPPARQAGETRARGRRGGQRRKRAAGGGDNSENAATDSLATSMALAALGDGL